MDTLSNDTQQRKQICLFSSRTKKVFFPTTEKLAIGRDKSCDVSILGDNSVSRFHATMVIIGETASLRDLESTNGTWVNGKQIKEPVMLKLNDEVRFGMSSYTLLSLAEGEIQAASMPEGEEVKGRKFAATASFESPSEHFKTHELGKIAASIRRGANPKNNTTSASK